MTQIQVGQRKTRKGVVLSNKMQKTLVVRVDRVMRHPQYDKVITRSKRYYAHCEDPSVKVGDTVNIMETRPLSRLKRWCVIGTNKENQA